MMNRCLIAFIGVTLTATSPLPAAFTLDEETAAGGLKEALEIGAGHAVELLGQVDGYWGDEDVRIPVPDEMEKFARAMRKVGLDDTVDEFWLSMNRAAEAAAPLARDVFIDTIKNMDFESAVKIVRGNKHEGTDYLRENAGPTLSELFLPVVAEQTEAVGATRAFNALMDSSRKLPFVKSPVVDLNAYVTEKALDGLFLMIAREEEKIREDPLARTTDLLKKVFGSEGKKKPWWKRFGSSDDDDEDQ